MSSVLGLLARALRLPGPPQPPPGASGRVRIFRPAAGFFRLRLLRWGAAQASAALGLLVAFGWQLVPALDSLFRGIHLGPISLAGFLESPLFRTVEIAGLAAFVAQLPVSLLLVRLDYVARSYLLTDRSLRIREGVTTVREQTMTFANVQNVTVRQGPLQRLLGVSDLEVRCAGGGDTGEDGGDEDGKLHVGYFRGVGDAPAIRDLVLSHVRALRSAGTGDPDDGAEPVRRPDPAPNRRLDDAIERLLVEAAAIRRAIAAARDPR